MSAAGKLLGYGRLLAADHLLKRDERIGRLAHIEQVIGAQTIQTAHHRAGVDDDRETTTPGDRL